MRLVPDCSLMAKLTDEAIRSARNVAEVDGAADGEKGLRTRQGRQLRRSPADREYAGELGLSGRDLRPRAGHCGKKQTVKHGWRPKLVLSKPQEATLVKDPR